MDEILCTPAAVLSLLTGIDELKHLNVGITETMDGQIQVQVGSSNYILNVDDATPVKVSTDIVETVTEINQGAYEDLEGGGEVSLGTPVSSGIIKELAKSLLLGGMIRLTTKLLKN